MLVHPTESRDPFAGMTLELIADPTPYPASPLPRRTTEMADGGPARRHVAGVVAIGTIVVAVLATAVLRATKP